MAGTGGAADEAHWPDCTAVLHVDGGVDIDGDERDQECAMGVGVMTACGAAIATAEAKGIVDKQDRWILFVLSECC